MQQKNEAVRAPLRIWNIKQWELAQALGIAEATLSRKLRTELPIEEQMDMVKLIEKIAAERGDVNDR